MHRTMPRAVKRAQTRGALVHAARELLLQRAFADMGIRDITARAGLSLATFYLHFGSKDDLLRQLARDLTEFHDEVLAGLTGDKPAPPGVRGRARQGALGLLKLVERDPALFLLSQREWHDAPPEARAAFHAGRARLVNRFAASLEAAAPPGTATPARAKLAAEALLTASFRLIRLWLEAPAEYPRADVIEAMADLASGLFRRQPASQGRG